MVEFADLASTVLQNSRSVGFDFIGPVLEAQPIDVSHIPPTSTYQRVYPSYMYEAQLLPAPEAPTLRPETNQTHKPLALHAAAYPSSLGADFSTHAFSRKINQK
jgi:hypothetical protein